MVKTPESTASLQLAANSRSPGRRNRLSQGRICRAGTPATPVSVYPAPNEPRTSPSINSPPSWGVPSCGQKNRQATSPSRTSCVATKQRRRDPCCRLAIRYAVGLVGSPGGCDSRLTAVDGKRHRQEVGRHATPMELHILRQNADRSVRSQDPPDRAAHEPTQEPRAHVRGHVGGVQFRGRLRGHPGCAGAICAGLASLASLASDSLS